MKKITLFVCIQLFISISTISGQSKDLVQVTIDLKTIENDKVAVTVVPPKIKTSEIIYHFPKTVPGTYSADNFGLYIDNFKVYDKKGAYLTATKIDDNSWKINDATKIGSISYHVNDTYDIESTHEIFSPVGSNIDAGSNIVLNTHCFVGFFEGYTKTGYKLTVFHPENLWGATSLTDADPSKSSDLFTVSRYAELVENPIMYSKPDYTTFTINDMQILIAVYSPNGVHTAEGITPAMKTMMVAQKNFLGTFNSTKKYSILIYLSDLQKENDAHGFGALEHPTATTVVMPEAMGVEEMVEQLKDIVSHEFFHIVTPLTIHSKEIQDFDYSNPKMSQHLWMYEGVTEYFANLFQVNQGLIDENAFYSRMASKIFNAKNMDDTIPFTVMSQNVLAKPYKDQYLNVYEKGALIGMCIDIIIREKSNGSRGILDLMQKLAKEYGTEKAFDDADLFAKITSLTYPEVGQFLNTHVSGSTPIPYKDYFSKVGVGEKVITGFGNPFLKGQVPTITVNQQTKEIIVLPAEELNDFYKELGIQGGDILTEINDTKYTLDNIYDLITVSQLWKNDDPITVKVIRNGKEESRSGKIKLPTENSIGYEFTDQNKINLKNAWLKS